MSALAICTKPLARQGMVLWRLDRVLDTEGGVHDTATPAHAGGSPATELLRTHSSPLPVFEGKLLEDPRDMSARAQLAWCYFGRSAVWRLQSAIQNAGK